MVSFYQSVSTHWSSLHTNLGSKPPSINKYKVMMWLPTLAYADEAEMSIIQTLISFYIIPEMGTIQVPQTLPRQTSDGYNCKKSAIESIVMSSCHSIDESPEANIVRDLRSESAEDFQTHKISLFRRHRAAAIDEFTNVIMNMWPCRAPTMTRYDGLVAVSQYVDVQKALIFASALFESWYDNKCFFEYLTEIETMLGRVKEIQTLLGMTCQDIGPTGSWQPWRVKHAQPILRRGLISIDDIFPSLAPFHVPFSGTDLTDFVLRGNRSEESMAQLSTIQNAMQQDVEHLVDCFQRPLEKNSVSSWKC